MDKPQTRAGQWLLDRSQWEDGLRAFRVRINATAGPDDMHRHILAIEKESALAALGPFLRRTGGLVVHFDDGKGYLRVPSEWIDDLADIAKAYREDTDAHD